MLPLQERRTQICDGVHDLVLGCQMQPYLKAIDQLREKQRELVLSVDWQSDMPVNPMHPTILKCREIEAHIKALMRQVLTISDFLKQKGQT